MKKNEQKGWRKKNKKERKNLKKKLKTKRKKKKSLIKTLSQIQGLNKRVPHDCWLHYNNLRDDPIDYCLAEGVIELGGIKF